MFDVLRSTFNSPPHSTTGKNSGNDPGTPANLGPASHASRFPTIRLPIRFKISTGSRASLGIRRSRSPSAPGVNSHENMNRLSTAPGFASHTRVSPNRKSANQTPRFSFRAIHHPPLNQSTTSTSRSLETVRKTSRPFGYTVHLTGVSRPSNTVRYPTQKLSPRSTTDRHNKTFIGVGASIRRSATTPRRAKSASKPRPTPHFAKKLNPT